MTRRLSIFLIIFCTLPVIKLFAQADISMATDWYNRGSYNPASIARPDYIYIFANNRRQWVGVEGAPKVLNIQASQYFHSSHSAFGISLVNDKIGSTTVINPMINYAYRLTSHNEWALSMGLSLGVYSRSIDGSLFDPVTDADPALYSDMEKVTRPDANFGLEFQSQHLVVGLSSTHLFSVFNDSQLFLNSNHRYGYVVYKNTDPVLFNYSFGVKVVNRSSLSVYETNASIRFKHPTGLSGGPRELFEVGLTYNTSHQAAFLLGINLTRNFKVGYAFDKTFQNGYNSNGTHEVMLEYRIPSKRSSTDIQCRCGDFWYY